MGLLSEISAENCVVSQGAAYVCSVDAASISTRLVGEEQDAGDDTVVVVYNAEKVEQWHGVCTFTAAYSYVGLSETAAKSAVTALRAAYTKSISRYAVGWYVEPTTPPSSGKYKYLPVGSAPVCGAQVTPVHDAGDMWRVDVSVNVTVEEYYDAENGGMPPTQAMLEALAAPFATADENVSL